jgi:hypothetical protein
MNKILDFLNFDPIYQVEGVFYESIFEFSDRINSLYRYWEINRFYTQNHLEQLEKLNPKLESLHENQLWYEGTAGIDKEYFPELLRGFMISSIISGFETLLQDICKEIAFDKNIKIELDHRPLPYINKYILWLVRGCGLDIELPKQVNRNLDVIREIRNQFIHRMDKGIPRQIQKAFSEMVDSGDSEVKNVNDDFVYKAFNEIAGLAKKIEKAYIKFNEN